MNSLGKAPLTGNASLADGSGTAQPRLTRDCLDPWNNIEISTHGQVRPCCIFHSFAKVGIADTDIDTIRNSRQFRRLRQSLLSGDLHKRCEQCFIRKTVPVDVLKQRLLDAAPSRDPAEILDPLPVVSARIDIDTKCNLRCDYCAVSSPTYHGVEMSDETFAGIAKLFGGMGPNAIVNVNGFGETTFHPKWMEMCQKMIDAGHRLQIITNLAKNFTDDEVNLLSKFLVIQISLDSNDNDLMKKIRKAVRAEKIFETIQRIREASARQHVYPQPVIGFSIGVYDPSIWTLEKFVDRLIGVGVRNMTFWNLVEQSHQKLVRPLRSLDAQEQIRARKILANVRRKLEAENVYYSFAGDFNSLVPELGDLNRHQWRETVRRVFEAFAHRHLNFLRQLRRRPARAALSGARRTDGRS